MKTQWTLLYDERRENHSILKALSAQLRILKRNRDPQVKSSAPKTSFFVCVVLRSSSNSKFTSAKRGHRNSLRRKRSPGWAPADFSHLGNKFIMKEGQWHLLRGVTSVVCTTRKRGPKPKNLAVTEANRLPTELF